MKSLIIKLFRKVKPFNFSFERMDGSLYIIGIRYNRFYRSGEIQFMNSFGLFYGRKYKVWQWLDGFVKS